MIILPFNIMIVGSGEGLFLPHALSEHLECVYENHTSFHSNQKFN